MCQLPTAPAGSAVRSTVDATSAVAHLHHCNRAQRIPATASPRYVASPPAPSYCPVFRGSTTVLMAKGGFRARFWDSDGEMRASGRELLQHRGRDLGVFGAAVLRDLAVGEAPPVVDVHRHDLAGLTRPGRVPDDRHHIAVIGGGERQRRELVYFHGLAERLEEAAGLLLAVANAPPGRVLAGRFRRPVDVVGAQVEDRGDIAATEGFVRAL